MVKNTAKMIGIKKMMKKSVSMSTLGGPVPRAAAAASDALPGDSAPQAKRSRNAETTPKEGVSGDILEDNFLVEDLAAGDQGDALDAGSDAGSDDEAEDRDMVAANRKRKTQTLKEKKKAKAGEGPRREDSLAIAAASAQVKHAFFLKHFRASDTGAKMGSVEIEDYVRSEHFLGMGLKLDAIGELLTKLCPGLMRAATPCGPTPLVAILVSSSQRGGKVYDLLKGTFKANMLVKAYESHSKVKKLLSKFLASDAAFGTRIVIATAGRLLRLLSGGELQSNGLEFVVLDLEPDAKQRTLLDMKEVREDVMKLHTQILSPLLNSAQMKIVFM